jgi:hypothetical protein
VVDMEGEAGLVGEPLQLDLPQAHARPHSSRRSRR